MNILRLIFWPWADFKLDERNVCRMRWNKSFDSDMTKILTENEKESEEIGERRS